MAQKRWMGRRTSKAGEPPSCAATATHTCCRSHPPTRSRHRLLEANSTLAQTTDSGNAGPGTPWRCLKVRGVFREDSILAELPAGCMHRQVSPEGRGQAVLLAGRQHSRLFAGYLQLSLQNFIGTRLS